MASLENSLVKNHKYLQSLILFNYLNSSSSLKNFNFSAFSSLIKSCGHLILLNLGKCYHGYILKHGFLSSIDINNSLIQFYLKLGGNVNAHKVFEEMPMRDGRYFDSVIPTFGSAHLFRETLAIFEEAIELGLVLRSESVRRAIIACGELRNLDKGMWVHNFVLHHGLNRNITICNALISMYVKMGKLDLARNVLNAMEERNLISWNTIITGYAQSGNWMKAFDVYQTMKKCGDIVHDSVTLLGLVFACGQAGDINQGMSVHGHSIRAGLLADFRLGTGILDMYGKCGRIESAEMLFEENTFEKSLVSWNSLISLYTRAGYYRRAVILFKKMSACSCFKPDSFTLANVIPAYSDVGHIDGIRSIHALITKKGLDIGADVVLGTALVDAYGKCSNIAAAEVLFYDIKMADTPTWNSMLSGYCVNDKVDEGLLFFRTMLKSLISPDTITITLLLQMCGKLGSLNLGSMAHGFALVKGFSHLHLMVQNALLDMYMRCKSTENAERLFAQINCKNIVAWNIMLCGYVNIASYSSAIKIFSQLQLESATLFDSITITSLVQASAASLTTYGIYMAHAYVVKLGFDSDTMVMNSLIDTYAKSGFIDSASSLFGHMGEVRDQWSWNVMFAGFGMNGEGEKACELLRQMTEYGYEPDTITSTALLSACAHSGMIDEGCNYFDLMVNKYKIQPSLEHWTCIINMFGRAGKLDEAYKLVLRNDDHNLPGVNASKSVAVWGTFMDACRTFYNIELGEIAGRKLLDMSPQNSGYPILLSNLYASTKKWDEAMTARQIFVDGSLVKEIGLSSVCG